MNKIIELLYKYYKKRYIKYRNKVLTEREIKFEEYKIEHNNKLTCKLDNSPCLREKCCIKDFHKYGCMYLKGWK